MQGAPCACKKAIQLSVALFELWSLEHTKLQLDRVSFLLCVQTVEDLDAENLKLMDMLEAKQVRLELTGCLLFCHMFKSMLGFHCFAEVCGCDV